MEYKWYSELNGSADLQQGDLIPQCPILIPPPIIELNGEYEFDLTLIDSIILSQSCDLANQKIEIVLVCPYYPLKWYISQLPIGAQKGKGLHKNLEDLRRGYLPGYHLINKSETFEEINDYQVVDFKNVYGIQFTALLKLVTRLDKRIRLLPPYREHLSQAFARYFMRVGLPQDITIERY